MINELTGMVIRLNGSPLSERQASQKTAKIWSDVLLFFRGNSKIAVITECKKAEQTVHQEYEEVLKHSTIADFTRPILEGHRDEIAEGPSKSFSL